MRRILFATALILMLGLIAYSQRTINATSQGNITTYNPIVYGPVPTPTPSPTVPVPTATATSVPQGTGVFKKDGNTVYRDPGFQNISACGFIRFWDGTPAFGGPDGFSAEACLDETNRCQYFSPPVDASGYYEIPIESYIDIPSDGGGAIYATKGRERDRVSPGFRWDFSDVEEGSIGVTIRIDFIECRVGDTNEACTANQAAIVNDDGSFLVAAPITEASPQSPTLACPDR